MYGCGITNEGVDLCAQRWDRDKKKWNCFCLVCVCMGYYMKGRERITFIYMENSGRNLGAFMGVSIQRGNHFLPVYS